MEKQHNFVYTPTKRWVVHVSTKLGSGSEGTVHPCIPTSQFNKKRREKPQSWSYVCKISTRKLSTRCASAFVHTLRHASLVVPLAEETCVETGYVYSVMPRYHIDTFGWVDKKGPRDEDVARKIVFEVLNVLDLMHSKNLAHRDIKHENILVSFHSSNPRAIKRVGVTDFGLAIKGEEGSYPVARGLAGSMDFLPPEAYLRHDNGRYIPYNAQKGDIWAIGVVLTFLRSGCGVGVNMQEHKVIYPSMDLSPEGWAVLRALTTWDPAARPKASELINMPWFDKYTKRRPSRSSLISSDLSETTSVQSSATGSDSESVLEQPLRLKPIYPGRNNPQSDRRLAEASPIPLHLQRKNSEPSGAGSGEVRRTSLPPLHLNNGKNSQAAMGQIKNALRSALDTVDSAWRSTAVAH